MADPPASSPADEARDPEAAHGTSTTQDTKEQEDMKGEAAVATSEPVREELVQSAVSFLSHPKVVASSDVQRRSFLENKGLTMDEIEEAFRRLLLSPPSNSDPETVTPVAPRHPKSYMEVMEMIQRGERPDDIQDINDEPPNPDQPISKPSMAPKPKPWEKQGQQSSGWDLKVHSSDPSESSSGVRTDSTSQATGSNNSSGHGDLMLTAEPATGKEPGGLDKYLDTILDPKSA
ncbi:unnamed protein product [Triticum turgidum subsp. durum]|uniref:Peroxisomal membrane protein PEX14 n=1 Tax=Triticum turgidum subsp. durum TaxID=4567 RepID=A0A9R0R6Q2_TRITD|nr:unnamed protein product [Triticum turgidum subsp. durum]